MIELLAQLGILAASLLVLVKAADYFLEASCSIARRFGLSELLISLTLVSLGTSLPELGIALTGAFSGHPTISLSSIVGSAIFNICVAIGLIAFITKVVIKDKTMIFRDSIMMMAVYLLLFFAVAYTGLDATWGVIFILLYLFYLSLLYWHKRTTHHVDKFETKPNDWLTAIAAIAAIYFSSVFAVDAAVITAQLLSIPQWLIGATILAAGSSIPEVVVSLVALRKKKVAMSVGNAIGSNTFDILVCLGLASIVSPITVDFAAVFGDFLVLFAASICVTVFALTNYRLSKKAGSILLLIYLLYIIYLVAPYLR